MTPNESLLALLHEAQARDGHLSQKALHDIARRTGFNSQEVFSVASFYTDFRFEEPTSCRQVTLQVCVGVTCHMKHGGGLQAFADRYVAAHRETLAARGVEIVVEPVECLGACAHSPAVCLDGQVFGRVTPERLKQLLDRAISPEEAA
jgi:formate dehydrogenase subunit gamma